MRDGITPRRIATLKAFENAATYVAATGGSTNSALHLPAMAHEAGIDFDLHDIGRIARRTPHIANLRPGGKYIAKDVFRAGGAPAIIKLLLDAGLLNGDCLTVTGKTLAENHADIVVEPDQDLFYAPSRPIKPTGTLATVSGNLAPDGAICKTAGLKDTKFRRSSQGLRQREGVPGRCPSSQVRSGRRSDHSATKDRRARLACRSCLRRLRRYTGRVWGKNSP